MTPFFVASLSDCSYLSFSPIGGYTFPYSLTFTPLSGESLPPPSDLGMTLLFLASLSDFFFFYVPYVDTESPAPDLSPPGFIQYAIPFYSFPLDKLPLCRTLSSAQASREIERLIC